MIHISKNKCVGCGLCIEKCASNSIGIFNSIASVNQSDCMQCQSCVAICPQSAIMNVKGSLLVAFGTDDGVNIKTDNHVGMSKYFHIWIYENGEVKYREMRENIKYKEDESKTHGDPGKARATASALESVDVLIGGKFGPNISRLKNKFVCAVVHGNRTITQAVDILKENINEIMEEKCSEEKKGRVLV
ncbi:MAG: 4Fe-4S binding protein [Chitinispirillaceae bacterium]|nr:4Fe-4S binding protein [Chitinispirillaceae bacterium]